MIFCFVSFLSEPCWVVSDAATNLELGWKSCGMEPFAAVRRKDKESRAAGCGFSCAASASQHGLLNLPGAASGLAWAPTCLPKPTLGWLPGMGGKQQRQE